MMTPQTNNALPEGEHKYTVREAVAIFASEAALTNAIDQLEASGIDRAEISVLAGDDGAVKKLRARFDGAVELADDNTVKRAAPPDKDARTEIGAAAVGLPAYAGGIGGMFAVAAVGGGLAIALPLVLAGGLAGGGLGAIAAYAIAKQHRDAVGTQMEKGGLLLWVRTATPEREQKVLALLREAGGQNVHIHDIDLKWGIEEVPLAHAQPDPFLEKARS